VRSHHGMGAVGTRKPRHHARCPVFGRAARVGSWPLPGFPSGRGKLTLADQASTSSVSSLAWPRTRSHGHELPLVTGSFLASDSAIAVLRGRRRHLACELIGAVSAG
jgi:hypothetical protein